MTTEAKHHIPWFLWPFAAVWKLIAVIVEMTGRLLAMILGIILMVVGGLVSLTIIGAIVESRCGQLGGNHLREPASTNEGTH